MHARRKRRDAVQIPVVAMADIAFLLMIFFMLTTTFMKNQGLAVVPEARTSKPLPPKLIDVLVTKDAQIFVDGDSVTDEALPGVIEQKLQETSKKEVTVRGDKEVAFGVVVRIMDVINAAGAAINIATTAEE